MCAEWAQDEASSASSSFSKLEKAGKERERERDGAYQNGQKHNGGNHAFAHEKSSNQGLLKEAEGEHSATAERQSNGKLPTNFSGDQQQLGLLDLALLTANNNNNNSQAPPNTFSPGTREDYCSASMTSGWSNESDAEERASRQSRAHFSDLS